MNHPAAQLANQDPCDSAASPSNTEPCEQQPLEQQSLKQQPLKQQSREQQLHTWLTQVFPNQSLQHEKIPGDASFRSYHRLTVDNQHYIVMDAPPEKESVKEFIAVGNLMAGHVHVPKMIATDEQQGFIVLEDLGNTDFADVIAKDLTDAGELAKTARYYQQAMQQILAIQKIEELASPYGIGRDIHVGDTIVGIKGRVGFEAAAASIIIKAHHLLEKHTLSKYQQTIKSQLSDWYGNWLHEALFLDPVMRNIESFLQDSQKTVNGKVFITLHPYRFVLNGIESENDLMSSKFGSYGEENLAWSGDDVKGFTKILSNSLNIYHQVNKLN